MYKDKAALVMSGRNPSRTAFRNLIKGFASSLIVKCALKTTPLFLVSVQTNEVATDFWAARFLKPLSQGSSAPPLCVTTCLLTAAHTQTKQAIRRGRSTTCPAPCDHTQGTRRWLKQRWAVGAQKPLLTNGSLRGCSDVGHGDKKVTVSLQ